MMQYILADTTGTLNLAQLRGFRTGRCAPRSPAVPGVAEIASFGGFEKQYQVEVDPAKLLAFGIPLAKVSDAVRASNEDVGGRVLGDGRQRVRGARARPLSDVSTTSAVFARTGAGRHSDHGRRRRERPDGSRAPAGHRRLQRQG